MILKAKSNFSLEESLWTEEDLFRDNMITIKCREILISPSLCAWLIIVQCQVENGNSLVLHCTFSKQKKYVKMLWENKIHFLLVSAFHIEVMTWSSPLQHPLSTKSISSLNYHAQVYSCIFLSCNFGLDIRFPVLC